MSYHTFTLIDNSGFKGGDKVCLTEQICTDDIEFGEATSGSYRSSFDGILGLAMANSPDYPTPFTQSVFLFFIILCDILIGKVFCLLGSWKSFLHVLPAIFFQISV